MMGNEVRTMTNQLVVGKIKFGDFRRLEPMSRDWGRDRWRGREDPPIDRHYIERFLKAHASDIRGRVLEIADDAYTRRFGGDRVTRSDVLHVIEGNPKATIIADLTRADHLPSDQFDCIIFTQTLECIYDVHAAMWTLFRLLKPGGVVLATTAGINHVSRADMERWGEYWRFTTLSARKLFEEVFPPANIEVQSYGNVLAAIGFLHGITRLELTRAELDHCDPDYQVTIAVRAYKPV